jgi:citrate lyase subunit beta/citryl-CoA lyase
MYRSLLFIPGNQPKMLSKAMGFKPDAYIPDMEDSVPIAEKVNARQVIKAYLKDLSDTGVPVIPRVNARNTGLTIDDLTAVVDANVYGISIGKIDTAEDVNWLCDVLSKQEKEKDMVVGSIRLILWIETARAVCNCFDICQASERIEAVAFGGEDFTHDMGIERLEDDSNVAYARNALCIAARAADLIALDTPFFQFRNEAGLVENARAAKHIGFRGKFAIHPSQVNPLNEVFSPSPQEIEYAKRVVSAFEEAERKGRGSTSLDGKVIDVPVAKRARDLLATQQ